MEVSEIFLYICVCPVTETVRALDGVAGELVTYPVFTAWSPAFLWKVLRDFSFEDIVGGYSLEDSYSDCHK